MRKRHRWNEAEQEKVMKALCPARVLSLAKEMLSSWARRVLGAEVEKAPTADVEPSQPPKLPVASRALRIDDGDESDKASEASLSQLSPLRGAETPGSRRHGSECNPCAWYWKPQGCLRGSECGYCHLCPEGEVKLRNLDPF
eukprot:g13285.t1